MVTAAGNSLHGKEFILVFTVRQCIPVDIVIHVNSLVCTYVVGDRLHEVCTWMNQGVYLLVIVSPSMGEN